VLARGGEVKHAIELVAHADRSLLEELEVGKRLEHSTCRVERIERVEGAV